VQVDRLAELRESQGLTLRDLAERSGVDANTINQVELGHRKPRPSTLRKLAKALDVEVADFFKELAAAGKAEAPETGPALLEKGLDAARQDEQKEAQAFNRLAASEGVLPSAAITVFEEDKFRAELRALGFPDEYFEGFIWPLVATVNQQERELSRLREENSRLKEEAEQESVHR
jgi:transcriptional regulator with XRE-family HTH domain